MVQAGKALLHRGVVDVRVAVCEDAGAVGALGLARFVTMQNHYNLIYREEEREMNPLCREEGVGLIPWSPLARGFLAGNRKAQTTRAERMITRRALREGDAEADEKVVERVEELARGAGRRRRRSRWRGICTSRAWWRRSWGRRRSQHLEDAMAAVDVELSKEEMAFLEEGYVPHRIAGH